MIGRLSGPGDISVPLPGGAAGSSVVVPAPTLGTAAKAGGTAAQVAGEVAKNVTPWNAIVGAIGSFFGLGGSIAQAVAAGKEAKTAREIAALNLVAQQQATAQQAAILREQQRLALIQAQAARLAPRPAAPPDYLQPAIVVAIAAVAIAMLAQRER